MKKVLISAPYMLRDIDSLMDFFPKNGIEPTLADVKEQLSEDVLLDIIEDFDGAICGDDAYTRRVMEKAKKLKVISKWGTGIDAIDSVAAEELGIKVCRTPNAFSHPVADTTLAYMLAFARNVIASDVQMKKGIWDKIRGFTLSEKTLGIIGLGDIGTQVAKRANAFNMKIIANDIREITPIIREQYNIEMVSKDYLYENADIISVHCDLNESSYHMIDMAAFKKMKRKPYIINTARGKQIVHDDLVKALEEGLISGAGLDVFEVEPLPLDDKLLKRDDVILAPHNSNNSKKYWEAVHKNTLANLVKYLEG
ncbi:MAG: phosphoglycerate dehydrogenase [Oscillospiraceae bacterium]|nr:phosphoglycerate dehydrogenase [Oscillospiraceae bacterium]